MSFVRMKANETANMHGYIWIEMPGVLNAGPTVVLKSGMPQNNIEDLFKD